MHTHLGISAFLFFNRSTKSDKIVYIVRLAGSGASIKRFKAHARIHFHCSTYRSRCDRRRRRRLHCFAHQYHSPPKTSIDSRDLGARANEWHGYLAGKVANAKLKIKTMGEAEKRRNWLNAWFGWNMPASHLDSRTPEQQDQALEVSGNSHLNYTTRTAHTTLHAESLNFRPRSFRFWLFCAPKRRKLKIHSKSFVPLPVDGVAIFFFLFAFVMVTRNSKRERPQSEIVQIRIFSTCSYLTLYSQYICTFTELKWLAFACSPERHIME